MEQASLPAPKFISESGRFKVIFTKEHFSQEFLESMGLSDHQLQAIAYLKEKGSISNSIYQEISGISKRTATRELNEMILKGLLITEGGSRGRGKLYRLKI